MQDYLCFSFGSLVIDYISRHLEAQNEARADKNQ